MWDWINASTIQAVSSVLSVIVTAVLVGITVRYVALTRTLAEAASAQLRSQAEAAAARRRGLQSEITLLINLLDSLPGSGEQGMADKLLRERTIEWADFDFRLFRMAASEVSLEAGQRASVVEAKMKWLGERVRSIKSVDPRIGFDWSNFDWREWNNAGLDVRESLQEIARRLA